MRNSSDVQNAGQQVEIARKTKERPSLAPLFGLYPGNVPFGRDAPRSLNTSVAQMECTK
jgi:hypothetical protein